MTTLSIMLALPADFFTPESMLTLAGAVVMTTVITNSFQYVFNWNPRWFGLVIAVIISIAGVIMTGNLKFISFVIGIINGFLIYANSAGIMQMAGTGRSSENVKTITGKQHRKFMDKWF
jgi:hypothetical protein